MNPEIMQMQLIDAQLKTSKEAKECVSTKFINVEPIYNK